MSDLTFTASDDAPSVFGALTTTGAPTDLSTAVAVRFQMRLSGVFSFTVDAPATIVDRPTGQVRYDWQPGDLSTAGDYLMRWEIHWNDGSVEHSTPANTLTVEAE